MSTNKEQVTQIPEPLLSRLLFADTRFAFIWLIFRLYIGYEWISAGWAKVLNPVWAGPHAGAALQGFLKGAMVKTQGAHPDVPGWYAVFLSGYVSHHATLISNMVAYGELLVGIALILGIFTGIATFFGAFMNMNYLFAGTVSINPIMFLVELFIILAWRVAGWYGLDRYILPLLGTPWQPGKLFKKK
jgi:thiosulfate dehydrogenase [quinone] large subunit